MLVRRFMSQDVFVLAPTATCAAAFQELARRGFRRAPVAEGGRLAGVVSRTDLARRLVFTPGLIDSDVARESAATEVSRVMITDVVTCSPNDHVEIAAERMLASRISSLPVIERERIVGMLTESDLFRALWSMLSWPKARRVAIEIDAAIAGTEPDFANLCRRHRCTLRSLLQSPREDGGRLVDLVIEGNGTDADALVAALWKLPASVLSTGRPTS
jgi:acetoin utilization protein AcuB